MFCCCQQSHPSSPTVKDASAITQPIPPFSSFIEPNIYKQLEARIALLNEQHAKLQKEKEHVFENIKESKKLILVCDQLKNGYSLQESQRLAIDHLRQKFVQIAGTNNI